MPQSTFSHEARDHSHDWWARQYQEKLACQTEIALLV
jgi:hypothetical protein